MNYLITGYPEEEQQTHGLVPLTISECTKKLINRNILGCDTETTGLRWKDDQLLMLQIYNGEDNFIIDCRTVDWAPHLKNIFESKKVIKIFHNAKFDYKFLKANGVRCESTYDTMLVEKVIHAGKKGLRFRLKDLMSKYYDVDMSKEVRNTFIGHKGPFTKDQIVYGLDDTVKLLDIREKQLAQVAQLELQSVVKLENEACLAFADIEYNGIHLDKERWDSVAEDVKGQIEILFGDLEEELHENHPEYRELQIDMFGGGRKNIINWASPLQVLKLMKKFDNTLDSVGGPALKHLANNDLVAKYIEFKEKSKLFNAYGPDFYKYLHSDGKVHTSFDQILDTGRVSSRGPNMQQIPADNTYRNAFVPGKPDWVFVSSDFSSQELCIIAFGSQDPVWLKVLREGGDLHSTCAELIFGRQWIELADDPAERKNTKEGKRLRTHVKTINFALAYGASYFTIARSLDISDQEAQDLIALYYRTFPRIKTFLDSLGKYGLANGNIRTFRPFRRIRHFDEWQGKKTPRKIMGKIKRASLNTPIQGSGADMTKSSLVLLRNEIHRMQYPAELVMTVHDQVDTICEADFAEQWAKILVKIMEKSATYIVGEGLLRCDYTISNEWQK